jgi:branched-chain amino acid transport system substrate-binding protein
MLHRSSPKPSTVRRPARRAPGLAGICLLPAMMLSACTSGPTGLFGNGGVGGPDATQATAPTPASRKVALLLPMSGANAFLGPALEKAARLGLDQQPGGPEIVVEDTRSTGAAEATRAAVAAGAGIIIGPLTAADTDAAAPIAQAAAIPMLALTSDVGEARPGVWVLGVTPEQQVARLVEGLRGSGQTRIGALLSQDAFGSAMADGLTTAAARAGLPPPRIERYGTGFSGINSGLRTVSDYAGRHPATDKGASAADAAAAPSPGLPIDALLLNATGTQLQEVISCLAFYDLQPDHIRILGPGLWGAFASKLKALPGAWFAAPDPSARTGYVQLYQARYHDSPRAITDIVYDAAALARSLSGDGYSAASLTREQGFAGVDGVFGLRPDGHVRRELAIFEIQPGGGAKVVQPAPGVLSNGS